MTNPPIQDNPAQGPLDALTKVIDQLRDAVVASDATIQAQSTQLTSIESRVAALEAKPGGGGQPIAAVIDITAAQESQLVGVPLGSVVELRGPTATLTAMRAQG